jgi:hypothetical protein
LIKFIVRGDDVKNVLVGIPTYEGKEYCLNEFIKGLESLTHKNHEADIIFVDNSKTSQYANRLTELGFKVERDAWCIHPFNRICTTYNKLREMTLKGGYDYLFVLEQDIIPPANALDKLVSHNKEIVSGVYTIMPALVGKKVNSCWYDKKRLVNGELIPIYMFDSDLNKGIKDWTGGGVSTGCVLIHRSVLDLLIFKTDGGVCQDGFFSRDCNIFGFKIYVDTDVYCKHLMGNWNEVFDESKMELEKTGRRPKPKTARDSWLYSKFVPFDPVG